MRICIIAWERGLDSGKSATHVWEVARELKKLDIEVNLIMPQLPEIIDKTCGLKIYFIRNKINIGYRVQFALLSVYQLLKLDRTKNFDIIYTRSLINFVPLVPIKWLLRKKLVLEANCIWSDEQIINDKGLLKNIKYFLIRSLELFAARHANCIITVTQGIKDYFIMAGMDPERIFLIENGANTGLFRPMDQRDAQRLVGLDGTFRYICFVGNLAPWQGVEYLVQAAPQVLRECAQVRFIVVGDGQMRDKLYDLAHQLSVFDKFIFTGIVPYERVPLYINASEVCVAPFIVARNAKIGLSPLKMYEYLACEKPVVASDIAGVKDLLEKSCGGAIIVPENPYLLAKAIIRLLQNEELRKEMGIKGRKYIIENNSWEVAARRVAEVCERTMNETRKTQVT